MPTYLWKQIDNCKEVQISLSKKTYWHQNFTKLFQKVEQSKLNSTVLKDKFFLKLLQS